MTLDGGASTDEMFSIAYEELRRLPYRLKQGDGSPTLNPTTLVHEAYLSLAQSKHFQAESVQHLKHTVVLAMRRLLVDAARRRAAASRGGGDAPVRTVALDESAACSAAFDPEQVLAVTFALDELAKHDELQARVFECQFFGGLQVAEIAELVGISEKKVQRTLRLAKTWLSIALGPSDKPRGGGE